MSQPREDPRPDRLREINWRLVRRYGYTGMNEPFGVSAMDADLKWLVAEVERLREENEQMYRDFRELAEIEGLLDD